MIPDNRDDIYRIITRLIEEFMADGGFPPGGRFRGYAIVAGPGGTPAVIRIPAGEHRNITPEIIESDGEVYISAALPPSFGIPSVTFQYLLVQISMGKETIVIDLPCRVDPQRCSWQVRNGVLDISCRKA